LTSSRRRSSRIHGWSYPAQDPDCVHKAGRSACPRTQTSFLEAWLNGRAISWGSGQYCTDSTSQRVHARARSRRDKTSEPHLYFARRCRASEAKGYNVHAPQSVPLGVLGLCPACGGETSIRLIEPMNTQGLERRTFECKACHERQAFVVAHVNESTHAMRH
jgi:hypothetical protein